MVTGSVVVVGGLVAASGVVTAAAAYYVIDISRASYSIRVASGMTANNFTTAAYQVIFHYTTCTVAYLFFGTKSFRYS